MVARTSHRGFSMYDMTFVLAIIAVLIALLLPAIQAAREAARRTQCRNNMRQLGLAMHNYHDVHKTFPPGITSFGPKGRKYVAEGQVCGEPQFARVSALTCILPFMGEKAVYTAYNFKLACCAKENVTAVGAVVKTYLCPSNPRGSERITKSYYPGDSAPTDYGLSLGGNSLLTTIDPFQRGPVKGFPEAYQLTSGPFNVNSSTRIRDFRDGTSNTFLMGEIAGGAQLTHGLPEIGAGVVTERHIGFAVDQPWSQGYIGTKGGSGGYGSVFASTAHDAWQDQPGRIADPNNATKKWTPNPMNMARLRMMRGTTYPQSYPDGITEKGAGAAPPAMLNVSVSPFRSYHAGGCNMLYCDGSVRYVAESVNAQLYVGLSSLQGMEIVRGF